MNDFFKNALFWLKKEHSDIDKRKFLFDLIDHVADKELANKYLEELALTSDKELYDMPQINKIVKYSPEKDKMFAHNFKLKFESDGKKYWNNETCYMCELMNIRLWINEDGQHDGRLWSDDWAKECETRLFDEIMSDIGEKVEEFIQKVNPFSAHKS